jgi:hypothetical protein
VAADRHLLVDAYNVIHAWPELRALLGKDNPDAARARLLELLRPIHDTEGWRVTVVFDGRGDELLIERPGTDLTFSCVYGPRGLSADGVIEQLVANAAERAGGKARRGEEMEIIVATRDNLLGEAAAACGARPLSPDGLLDWAQHAAARQRENVATRSKRTQKDWRAGGSPWDKLSRPG